MTTSRRLIQRRAREKLDDRFRLLQPASRFAVPPKSWIRALRDALGMSGAQLGRRMGVSPQAVAEFEKSEEAGTIQLNSFKRAAEAMNCHLVYILVPAESLQQTVETQARQIAEQEVARIDHTMALEDQPVDSEGFEAQVSHYKGDDNACFRPVVRQVSASATSVELTPVYIHTF